MATTIINPSPNNESSSSNGIAFLIGIIILVVLGLLFFVYGLPYLRGFSGTDGVQINVPVPEKIDVKVQQTK